MNKKYNLTNLKHDDVIAVAGAIFRVTDLDLTDQDQAVELTLESIDLSLPLPLPLPLPEGLFIADFSGSGAYMFRALGDVWWIKTPLLVRYNIIDDRKPVRPVLCIESGKCYRTRNGRKAQVISHRPDSDLYPFIGIIFGTDGVFRGKIDTWTADGRAFITGESDTDLISLYC